MGVMSILVDAFLALTLPPFSLTTTAAGVYFCHCLILFKVLRCGFHVCDQVKPEHLAIDQRIDNLLHRQDSSCLNHPSALYAA